VSDFKQLYSSLIVGEKAVGERLVDCGGEEPTGVIGLKNLRV
jgi:hypothetical protein